MAANAHVKQLKQSLHFFSRTCSVFKEEDSNYAPTPGQLSVAQQVAHEADNDVRKYTVRPAKVVEATGKPVAKVTPLTLTQKKLVAEAGKRGTGSLNSWLTPSK